MPRKRQGKQGRDQIRIQTGNGTNEWEGEPRMRYRHTTIRHTRRGYSVHGKSNPHRRKTDSSASAYLIRDAEDSTERKNVRREKKQRKERKTPQSKKGKRGKDKKSTPEARHARTPRLTIPSTHHSVERCPRPHPRRDPVNTTHLSARTHPHLPVEGRESPKEKTKKRRQKRTKDVVQRRRNPKGAAQRNTRSAEDTPRSKVERASEDENSPVLAPKKVQDGKTNSRSKSTTQRNFKKERKEKTPIGISHNASCSRQRRACGTKTQTTKRKGTTKQDKRKKGKRRPKNPLGARDPWPLHRSTRVRQRDQELCAGVGVAVCVYAETRTGEENGAGKDKEGETQNSGNRRRDPVQNRATPKPAGPKRSASVTTTTLALRPTNSQIQYQHSPLPPGARPPRAIGECAAWAPSSGHGAREAGRRGGRAEGGVERVLFAAAGEEGRDGVQSLSADIGVFFNCRYQNRSMEAKRKRALPPVSVTAGPRRASFYFRSVQIYAYPVDISSALRYTGTQCIVM
ncbi:hypothetical protein C8R45DRAFT_1175589 [Mycena sanguinolenta]|nr:hypothetical protein C8R45DRAFT_1175589 [Mycena sanguinolenta]